jgi:hypothetical protein
MKQHPNTPGFWMDYKLKVAKQLRGEYIKKGELDRVMYCYINDISVDDCVKDLHRRELM